MSQKLSPITLQRGVVDVWYADLEQLNLDLERGYAVLDTAERVQATKFKFKSLSDQYVLSHGLLRMLLASYLQVSPATLRINRTVQGKPFLVDYPGLSFNMSHTGTKLLIAVTEVVALGVDIEAIKPRMHLEGLVARCFASEEQRHWLNLPESEKLWAFFDFWTRKEAFVKAVGQGIALGLDQCVINPSNPSRFLRIPSQWGSIKAWGIVDLAVDVGCRAAVVARLNEVKVNVLLIHDYLQHGFFDGPYP